MKKSIYKKLRVLIIIFFMSCSLFGIAQEKTVDEILKQTQEVMKKNNQLTCNLEYNWYDIYTTSKPSLNYKGIIIKQNHILYSKINQTFFITDYKEQLAIKCNEAQKALLVTKANGDFNQSPWELLEAYMKEFKFKKVTDNGDHWICTLTTDVITQLPYGKIEVYINKQNALMTKQVLYFLSQVPYTNNDGEKKMGNPKLEIVLSNYKTVLNQEEKQTVQLTSYIQNKGEKITPTAAYKTYQIIQN